MNGAARALIPLFLLLAGLPALAQVSPEACGPLQSSHYGPFDYRGGRNALSPPDNDTLARRRMLVENAHFTPRVEMLLGSQSAGLSFPPGGDLDYTLRAFPNNPRALLAVMRYGEKAKKDKPEGLHFVVECYFERAIRFAPNDNVARMVYTTFLTKKNRKTDALQQLQMVLNSAKDNPFTHFNVGLLYFDLGEHQEAVAQARKAKELGFVGTALIDQLKAAGKWTEPVADLPTEAATAETSAPASAPAKP